MHSYPMTGGSPGGTGRATGENVSRRPRKGWVYKVPRALPPQRPYISENRVLFSDRASGDDVSRLFALDATSGKELWAVPQVEPGISSLGCLTKDLAFHYCIDQQSTKGAAAFSILSGKEIWRIENLPVRSVNALVVEDTIIVTAAYENNDRVTAIDSRTGSLQWQSDATGTAWWMAACNERVIVAGSTQTPNSKHRVFFSELVSLSVRDGSVQWARDLSDRAQWRDLVEKCLNPGSIGHVVASRGGVYCSMEGGTMLCLEESTGEIRWSYHFEGGCPTPAVPVGEDILFTFFNRTYRVSACDGRLQYVKEVGDFRWPPSGRGFLADDAYVYPYGHELRSLNPETGDLFWVKKFPDAVTSAIACAGRLFVTCVNGELHALLT